MYKEYREMSRCDAVESLYQDMAARHRARFRSIHVRFNVDYLNDGANCFADPEGCRGRQNRRYQTTIHQADSTEEPQIPATSPRPQGGHEDLHREQTVHLLLVP